MDNQLFDRIIEITLAAIDREKGVKALSLRAIAREAGCSHVNLYHYVENLEALVWRAYCRALEEYRNFCREKMDNRGALSLMGSYAAAVLGFARLHSGWYRLLWLDDLGNAPPDFALEAIGRISGEYGTLASRAFGGSPSPEKGDIYFSWLLGKVSFLASGRFLNGRDTAEREILEGAASLERVLSGY